MKTLEELVKELGLKPDELEMFKGRIGNFVHITEENKYVTFNEDYSDVLNVNVVEVKPE